MDHLSVAMEEIQERRAPVKVPLGRPLHEYVNLYICARNPMMYKRRNQHSDLTVLRVNPAILDLADVVVADGNASSGYTRFAAAPQGLDLVNRDMVYAEDWRHPNNPFAYWEHRRLKCAEVLVPDRVASEYLVGAYVSCLESEAEVRQHLDTVHGGLEVSIDRHLFFL